jgi:hypothetical protein
MLGGTEHNHLEPWFRPRQKPVEPPPGGGEPTITVAQTIGPGTYKLVQI